MLAQSSLRLDAAAPRCAVEAARSRWAGPGAVRLQRRRSGGGGGAALCRPRLPPAASGNGSVDPDFVMVPWDASRETWDDESARRMADLMRRFEAADTDGNGVIDREELRALLEHVGGGDDAVPMSWLTDADVDEVLAQYDTNSDGVISFDEFARMAQDNIFLTGKLEEYQAAFRAVDAGGNGSISATELFQLFQKLGQPISYDKLVQVMERYDVDQSGVIDFGEFLRMFRGELLDLQAIVEYLKRRTATKEAAKAAAAAAKAASAAAAAAKAAAAVGEAAAAGAAGAGGGQAAAAGPKLLPGGVNLFFSEEEFDAVLAAHPDKVVVLMGSVTWCRPCRAFQDKYERAAQHYGDAIFLKFYGNSNESTKALFKDRLKCRTTPSFFVFRHGQIVERCTGAVASRLDSHIRAAYGPEGPSQPPLWPEEAEGAAEAAAASPAAA